MKYFFHFGHPAHYHLCKNLIFHLQNNGHDCKVAIKKKDVLEDLLKSSGIDFVNILPEGRKDGLFNIGIGLLKQTLKIYSYCKKYNPDLMIGSTPAVSQVAKLLSKKSIQLVEDDAEVVPLYVNITYPFANHILVPEVCSVGKWNSKKIGYESYHELAYLHPNNFKPSREIALKYVNTDNPYYIIRFSKLNAFHDTDVQGISYKLALEIIDQFKKFGEVYITSERELEPEFEKYRISVEPKDMHHVMSFASFFVGDSQTMAAEAAVMGVPFIRINDFSGKISYLKELEEKYELGYSFLPKDTKGVLPLLSKLLNDENINAKFKEKKNKMLSEKIDYNAFLIWFIENYPKSADIMVDNPSYQHNLK